MAIYRIQSCLQGTSGSSEDRFCNTWYVSLIPDVADISEWDTLGVSVLNAFFTPSTGFYNVVAANGFSDATNGAGATFKIYRLADPEPRVPVYSFMFPSGPFSATGSGIQLPNEVAVCLSYEAIAVAGTNRARRRGRVYLGPLSTEVVAEGTGGPVVASDFMGVITTAYDILVTTLESITGLELGVYSQTDNLFLQAQTAWVDDAFDTQRRRGRDPLSRDVWTR